MNRWKPVVIAATFAVIVTAPLPAQQSEIGIFASLADLDSRTESDPDLGDVSLDFKHKLGYGVSYNRYFGDALSIEFAAQQINSDAEFNFRDGAADFSFDLGSVDLMAYSAVAQWHLGRGAIVPYIGVGAAMVSGKLEVNDEFEDPDSPGDVDFKDETALVANAGIDFRFGRGLAIGIDGKYIPYEAAEEGLDEEAIDLNPLIISAAIKFRF